MKKVIAAVMLICLCGCSTVKDYLKEAKVELPDVKIEKPSDVTTPAETSQCSCDLSKAIAQPPYDPEVLKAGGNKYECPTVAGRDVRLACKRVDKPFPFLLGNLLPKACSFDGNMMSCKCFDADGGRYHFTGYSRTFEGKDFVATKPREQFKYQTTTFVWYEYRK